MGMSYWEITLGVSIGTEFCDFTTTVITRNGSDAQTAIDKAERKASERGLTVQAPKHVELLPK